MKKGGYTEAEILKKIHTNLKKSRLKDDSVPLKDIGLDDIPGARERVASLVAYKEMVRKDELCRSIAEGREYIEPFPPEEPEPKRTLTKEEEEEELRKIWEECIKEDPWPDPAE